jgi:hypothetical protein
LVSEAARKYLGSINPNSPHQPLGAPSTELTPATTNVVATSLIVFLASCPIYIVGDFLDCCMQGYTVGVDRNLNSICGRAKEEVVKWAESKMA